MHQVLDFINFIISRLKKGAKYLFEELSKLIDEIFGVGKKVEELPKTASEQRVLEKRETQAKRLEERKNRAKKKYEKDNVLGNGKYGGKILSNTEIEKWAESLFKKYGTKIEKIENFENPNTLAAFDPNTNTIKFKNEVTEYYMAHESFHAEEMHLLGFEEYVRDCPSAGTKFPNDYSDANLLRSYRREKYVYDKIVKNAKKYKLNEEELRHNYFNLDFYKYHLEQRNIKI